MHQSQSTATNSEGALSICGNFSTLELAPLHLAISNLAAANVTFSQGAILSLYGQGRDDLPNLRTRAISHLATNSETQGLRYSVAHPDLRIILTLTLGHYRIVGRRSAAISQLSDLGGKRIGTMPKTSSAYFLHRMLTSVGLSESDVTLVPFVSGTDRPLSLMSKALADKEIDAITIWEPEMQKSIDVLGTDAIEFPDTTGYCEHFCLYSTKQTLDDLQRRQQILTLVQTLMKSSGDLIGTPETAQELVSRASGFDINTVKGAWRHHAFPANLDEALLEVLTAEERWVALETNRRARSRQELSELLDFSIFKEALES